MKQIRIMMAALALATGMSLALPLVAAAAPEANASGCATFYTVKRGDHLYRIAIAYKTSVASLTALNGLANANHIWTGQVLCVKAAAPAPNPGTFYTVVRGDNLSKIAKHFGWSVDYLARVNHITNINRIFVGQELFIPAH
ncbi:MAG: LysM peptidoglycan-binding domain-containing protein [Burkholderiaceae bacterium]